MDVSSYAYQELIEHKARIAPAIFLHSIYPLRPDAGGSAKQGAAAKGIGLRKHFSTYRHSAGFTLLELMIVVTIIILTTLGIPALHATLTTNRLANSVNDLVGTLAYARSEAIKRNQHVAVCLSNDGTTCTTGSDWSTGWLVYPDSNRNRQRDADETILGQYQDLATGLNLTYRAFGSRRYLVYRPNGTTRTNGTFTFCDPSAPGLARAVILSKTGRARLSDVSSNGDPLVCG